MRALHIAVARAIRESARLEMASECAWAKVTLDECAAAAIGVVLAEAQRSIEGEFRVEHDVAHAAPGTYYEGDARAAKATMAAQARALAVLAALGEQA